MDKLNKYFSVLGNAYIAGFCLTFLWLTATLLVEGAGTMSVAIGILGAAFWPITVVHNLFPSLGI